MKKHMIFLITLFLISCSFSLDASDQETTDGQRIHLPDAFSTPNRDDNDQLNFLNQIRNILLAHPDNRVAEVDTDSLLKYQAICNVWNMKADDVNFQEDYRFWMCRCALILLKYKPPKNAHQPAQRKWKRGRVTSLFRADMQSNGNHGQQSPVVSNPRTLRIALGIMGAWIIAREAVPRLWNYVNIRRKKHNNDHNQ